MSRLSRMALPLACGILLTIATADVIRAGSFASVNDLVRDINTCLAERNADPKPYRWRAQGADILAKIKRARAALENLSAA